MPAPKVIRSPEDIGTLGTVLCVWAHPDDETFTSAGIMAMAVANGQTVVVVHATKGELGVQDESHWPKERLGDIRAGELEEALKILGVTRHHWLGYKDGQCADSADSEAAAKIKEYIQTYKPQTILTFGPEGMTGHPDHMAVSRWVSRAAEGTDVAVYHAVQEENTYTNHLQKIGEQFNFFFNINKPPLKAFEDADIALRLPAELLAKKCAALKAMPSQYEKVFHDTPLHLLKSAWACECFMRAVR